MTVSTSTDRKQKRATASGPADIQVIVGSTVAMATVYFSIGDLELTGLGETKRLPGDVWDPDTGGAIALGRALQDAGRQLLREYEVGLP